MAINTHEQAEDQEQTTITPEQAKTWLRVMVSKAGQTYTGRIIMRSSSSFLQLREDVPASTNPEEGKYTDPTAFDENFDLRRPDVHLYPHPQDHIPGLETYDEAPRILQAARESRRPEIVPLPAISMEIEVEQPTLLN